MTAKNNNEDEEVLTPEDGTHDDEIEEEEVIEDENLKDKEEAEDDEITDEDEPKGEDDEDEDEEDAPPPPTQVDYKEKFGASTRQNQILTSQLNELKKQIWDITKEEIPSDEEMAKYIGLYEWETLSDRERNTERKLLIMERRNNATALMLKNMNKENELKAAVNDFIELDENKDIQGMNNDFLEFVKLPKNSGASFETLKDAFLFKRTQQQLRPKKSKSPSLLRGSSTGGAPSNQNGEMSDEQLTQLRTKNPKLYNDMIRKGKIK